MKSHICGLDGGNKRCIQNSYWETPCKVSIGRLIRRWVGYIKIDLMKIGCDYVSGSGLDPMVGFGINNTASKSYIATYYLGSPLKWGWLFSELKLIFQPLVLKLLFIDLSFLLPY
jgi:hypothetical protein